MPEKRKDTHRVTFYLSDNAFNSLNAYVAVNYTMADGYGAYSRTADAAISCFCANVNNRTECGVDANVFSIQNHTNDDPIIISTPEELLNKPVDTKTDDDEQWKKTYPDAEDEDK